MEGNRITGSDQPGQQVIPKKSNEGKRGIWIFFVLVAIVLSVTNPSIDDFGNHMVKGISDESDSMLSKGIANTLGKAYIEASTDRDNYVIFSTFTVVDGENYSKFLGFFSSFFIRL